MNGRFAEWWSKEVLQALSNVEIMMKGDDEWPSLSYWGKTYNIRSPSLPKKDFWRWESEQDLFQVNHVDTVFSFDQPWTTTNSNQLASSSVKTLFDLICFLIISDHGVRIDTMEVLWGESLSHDKQLSKLQKLRMDSPRESLVLYRIWQCQKTLLYGFRAIYSRLWSVRGCELDSDGALLQKKGDLSKQASFKWFLWMWPRFLVSQHRANSQRRKMQSSVFTTGSVHIYREFGGEWGSLVTIVLP